ncbi:hypothetical protein FA15DRAFT_701700 [Coprinopsis marcescibilis]|uniref:Uncharacterized protein n=1 Tax=Coprinopsis marcescibilis TaxID=230819 RepID=A0A5C3L4R5_COPMA|nr:hypothetical protein FA15DRAFT_701700 [Coprinopsis marcescibilis]
MDTLRRRATFKAKEGDEEDELILDEQGKELINDLKEQNAGSNALHRLLLRAILGLSVLVQLIYLFNSSKDSPFLSIFPLDGPRPSPLPLSTILTLLSIGIHGNLCLLSRPQAYLSRSVQLPKPLPLDITYAASAVAPALALFLRKPWQLTVWWLITPAIIFVAQTILEAIDEGDHSVAELEAMKYRAPGA